MYSIPDINTDTYNVKFNILMSLLFFTDVGHAFGSAIKINTRNCGRKYGKDQRTRNLLQVLETVCSYNHD